MAKANWATCLSCLIAGGSLGYLLAEPSSAPVTASLATLGGAACLLSVRRKGRDRADRELDDDRIIAQRRFPALVKATSGWVWTTTADGQFDTPQKTWTELTGQKFGDLAGWGWLSAVHPEDRDRVSKAWLAAVTSKSVYECEYRVRGSDGQYRVVLARAAPVIDADGRVIEWMGLANDVTEQSRARDVLAEGERQIHRVLDSLFAFVCVLTPEGTLVGANLAPLRAAGITLDDVQGKPFWDCYWWTWSPLAQEEVKTAVARAREGQTTRCDIDIRVAGGALITIDFMMSPMRDESGHITHLIPSGVDVSDRKKAEAALSEREQFYRQLIESMPLLTWTCLPDGTCDYICSRWEKFAGHATDPVGLFTTMELMHVDDRAAFRNAWQVGIASGQPFQAELRLRRNDGVYRWFACYATPIRNTRGQVVKWCGTSIDIDDRKQMEEALRQSESRLRSVNSTLERRVKERTREVVERSDQLRALALDLSETESRERKRLAQILHDHFQQLISAAKLKAGVLRRGSRDEGAVQGLRQIESLLEEAINASRTLATELSPPVLHDVGLVPALQWLARRMESDHQLNVELTVDAECEPDNEQVRVIVFECVRELLFNVRKHAGVESARLTLRHLPEGLLRVQVADDGKGFEAMKLGRRKASDMSFGLFSVRERMSLIGGLLTVDSEPGKGTRVELSVPCISPLRKVSSELAEPAHVAPASRIQARGPKLRVLVADDHALFREGLVALLAQEPYIEVVGQAADGEEAIRMARQFQPDLMIVDVSMPKANGVQVTALVSRELPDTKVVGLSMHEQEDMARSMRDAGAVAYFAKSGAPEETLLALLRSATAEAPTT